MLENYFLQVFLEMEFVLMREMHEVCPDDQKWIYQDYRILNWMEEMDLDLSQTMDFDRQVLFALYQVGGLYGHDLMHHRSEQS